MEPASCKQGQMIKEMQAWLQAGGAKFPRVTVNIEAPGMRNVVSTKAIKRGEEIIYIPKEQIISLETIKTSTIIQNILKHKMKLHSPKHCLLAVYLLQQKHDQNSVFRTYIGTLPRECGNFPIFYSEEEMKELKGSPLFEAVEQRKFEIQSDHKSLIQKDIGLKITYEDFCWARMVVCSRIFGIVMGEQKTDALVPLADMLNHGVMKQTIWSYSNAKEGFVIESLENISKGVQIYDSYGRKSNSRFLLNYGFVIQGNESDEVQIKLKVDRKLKNKLLEVCEQDPCKFVFKLGAEFDSTCFQELISTVRFIKDVEANGDPEVEQHTFKTSFRSPSDSFTSFKNQLNCWDYLHKLLNQMLQEYSTSLEEDVTLLETGDLSNNVANCIKLRVGQKKILNYYLDICQKMKVLFQMSSKNFKRTIKKKSYRDCEDYLYKINSQLQ